MLNGGLFLLKDENVTHVYIALINRWGHQQCRLSSSVGPNSPHKIGTSIFNFKLLFYYCSSSLGEVMYFNSVLCITSNSVTHAIKVLTK